MRNRFGDECQWHLDLQAPTHLDSLQIILNCASVQGCGDCVSCSERALDLFLKEAHCRAATGNGAADECDCVPSP